MMFFETLRDKLGLGCCFFRSPMMYPGCTFVDAWRHCGDTYSSSYLAGEFRGAICLASNEKQAGWDECKTICLCNNANPNVQRH